MPCGGFVLLSPRERRPSLAARGQGRMRKCRLSRTCVCPSYDGAKPKPKVRAWAPWRVRKTENRDELSSYCRVFLSSLLLLTCFLPNSHARARYLPASAAARANRRATRVATRQSSVCTLGAAAACRVLWLIIQPKNLPVLRLFSRRCLRALSMRSSSMTIHGARRFPSLPNCLDFFTRLREFCTAFRLSAYV